MFSLFSEILAFTTTKELKKVVETFITSVDPMKLAGGPLDQIKIVIGIV